MVSPGVMASVRNFGDISHSSVYPTMDIGVDWYAGRKIFLSGNVKFYMDPAAASVTNPILTKLSELIWIKGNPDLKNTTEWQTGIRLLYMPLKWMSVTFSTTYDNQGNASAYIYNVAGKEMGGLIKEYLNTAAIDRVSARIAVTGRFFKNALSLTASTRWNYVNVHNELKSNCNDLVPTVKIDYVWKNFRLGVSYEGPHKNLLLGGMQFVKSKDNWTANLSYGIDNFLFKFEVRDIFHKKRERWSMYNSNYYVSDGKEWTTGRYFVLTASYTFDYGKKVDKSIDINSPELVGTSVLH